MTSGVKEQEAMNYLERQFKKKSEYSAEEAIQLAILTLQSVIGQDFKASDLEVGFVSKNHRNFRPLNDEEVEVHLNAIANRD